MNSWSCGASWARILHDVGDGGYDMGKERKGVYYDVVGWGDD